MKEHKKILASAQYWGYLDTQMGPIMITAEDQGITSLNFHDQQPHQETPQPHIDTCKQQLQEYFAGQRTEFDLPLAAPGTAFQQQVWLALRTIPYGQTCSYGDIARKINNPKAVRAVGAANGMNPIAIIVPCHRIIGTNGTLTGYAGGLERKSWLLSLENPQLSLGT